jgi:hypothetical protein
MLIPVHSPFLPQAEWLGYLSEVQPRLRPVPHPKQVSFAGWFKALPCFDSRFNPDCGGCRILSIIYLFLAFADCFGLKEQVIESLPG